MRVTINGELHALHEGLTIAALIAHLGLKPRRVAVEVNSEIVSREAFTTRTVAENDAIEIVQFVGGG